MLYILDVIYIRCYSVLDVILDVISGTRCYSVPDVIYILDVILDVISDVRSGTRCYIWYQML